MSENQIHRPAVLVFHKLLSRFSYGVTNYSIARFERLLEAVVKTGRRFVPLETEAARPQEGRGVAISFDDGYAHLSDHLPGLIERLPFRPVIFMPAGLIGRTNDWDYSYRLCPTPHLDRRSIRSLVDRGVEFGSHGLSHCDLTRCTGPSLKKQLTDSRKLLQDITGQAVNSISYPFGRSDRRVAQAAAEAGYRQGYTMSFPGDTDQPLERGRIPVYAFDTRWSLQRKLGGGLAGQVERLKTATVNRLAGGTVLLNRLRSRPSD